MRIFVTGATGYVGSAVAERLKTAGHAVIGLARSDAAAAKLQAAGYGIVRGFAEDAAVLQQAAQAADAVVHCALQAAIDALLAALAGTGRPFIYTSGVWVYGDTRDRMLGEVAALRPPELVAWRPAVEDAVLAAAERDVDTMVFRPGMVFGRNGGTFQGWFDSAASEQVIRVVGDGENHWSAVHADDLADLYRRAVEQPVAGELFVACSGMPQKVNRLAEAVRHCAGEDVRIEHIPLAQARQQMGPVADCLAMDCKAGSTKAVRFFGWAPKYPDIVGFLSGATAPSPSRSAASRTGP